MIRLQVCVEKKPVDDGYYVLPMAYTIMRGLIEKQQKKQHRTLTVEAPQISIIHISFDTANDWISLCHNDKSNEPAWQPAAKFNFSPIHTSSARPVAKKKTISYFFSVIHTHTHLVRISIANEFLPEHWTCCEHSRHLHLFCHIFINWGEGNKIVHRRHRMQPMISILYSIHTCLGLLAFVVFWLVTKTSRKYKVRWLKKSQDRVVLRLGMLLLLLLLFFLFPLHRYSLLSSCVLRCLSLFGDIFREVWRKRRIDTTSTTTTIASIKMTQNDRPKRNDRTKNNLFIIDIHTYLWKYECI